MSAVMFCNQQYSLSDWQPVERPTKISPRGCLTQNSYKNVLDSLESIKIGCCCVTQQVVTIYSRPGAMMLDATDFAEQVTKHDYNNSAH